MEYILHLFTEEKRFENLSPERGEARFAAYMAYRQALEDAKVLVGGARLRPGTESTCVRVGADGATSVLDGPFADTKEAFAGIFMLDVPDLDAAIAWAEKCPATLWGTVEIRPSAVRFVAGAWTSAP